MHIAPFCMTTERTKHIHAQRSFRFLAERHETFANGTLAKRLPGVGETTGHQIKGTSAFFFNGQCLLALPQVTLAFVSGTARRTCLPRIHMKGDHMNARQSSKASLYPMILVGEGSYDPQLQRAYPHLGQTGAQTQRALHVCSMRIQFNRSLHCM